MPLTIVFNESDRVQADAVVQVARPTLLGACPVGEARIVSCASPRCRYLINTVAPRWRGGESGEWEQICSCYTASLTIAARNGCQTVAVPLIGAGADGCERAQALIVAKEAIARFLLGNDLTVLLLLPDADGKRRLDAVARYLAKRLGGRSDEDAARDGSRRPAVRNTLPAFLADGDSMRPLASAEAPMRTVSRRDTEQRVMEAPTVEGRAAAQTALDDAVRRLDESFSQMLLRKIDERGMTDAACYKKANVDRKLFSKIRSDLHYQPSKATALAFSIALELSMAETCDLLRKAGFALSGSSKFDVIIAYFIESGDYDLYRINEALLAFDQSLLGA